MTLKQYRQKRSFDKTPEPRAGKINKAELPVFCVQMHDASRLHYDFRLEHRGTLLSWAVPKGPSMNPAAKHLAVQVEDHPYDYRDFEGIIPKGNYGAGTVMVWDEGVYTVPGAKTRKEIEKAISAGLKKGHLDFFLSGHKLQGLFSLIQMKDEKQWLLIKKNDEFATLKDVLKSASSVKTQRTLKEIAGGISIKNKKKGKKLPTFTKPMLTTLVDEPFDDPEWIFETKWDGYRALSYIDKDVNVYSRNGNAFNLLFAPIVKELSKLKTQCVLDGEIVVLDKKGRPDFQLMQNYQKNQIGALCYYVFDLLFLDGEDMRDLPLLERKSKLRSLFDFYSLELVRYSDHVDGKGVAFFKKAIEHNLEGIVAKKKSSIYRSIRSKEWQKIKTHQRQEVVIGGFTAPRGGRKHFGALLVGVYNSKKEFVYAGHIGTGFNSQTLKDVYAAMQQLLSPKCPFNTAVKANAPVTWVLPKLVCEVSFAEWTDDGVMRQPTFEGLRIDKKAKDVKREIAR